MLHWRYVMGSHRVDASTRPQCEVLSTQHRDSQPGQIVAGANADRADAAHQGQPRLGAMVRQA